MLVSTIFYLPGLTNLGLGSGGRGWRRKASLSVAGVRAKKRGLAVRETWRVPDPGVNRCLLRYCVFDLWLSLCRGPLSTQHCVTCTWESGSGGVHFDDKEKRK